MKINMNESNTNFSSSSTIVAFTTFSTLCPKTLCIKLKLVAGIAGRRVVAPLHYCITPYYKIIAFSS